MELAVLVPTRGRPQAAQELLEAFRDTCELDTEPWFIVDADDPARPEYEQVEQQANARMVGVHTNGMVPALNEVATALAATHPSTIYALGFMGDDHRPRTAGWDRQYVQALRKLRTGFVYGTDGVHGEVIPTQIAMTTDIVRALGYMALPALRHLYVDDTWRELGRAANCIQYLPRVTVEHMHPIVNKGAWDSGYARVNADEVYQHDKQVYNSWRLSAEFTRAVQAIRELRQQ